MRRRSLILVNLLILVLTVALVGATASAAADSGHRGGQGRRRDRVRGELLVRQQFGGPGSPCAVGARACLIGTAEGDLTGQVQLDIYDARTGDGSARRVDAASVNVTLTTAGGRVDGIGVALLYAETRDQLTRVEWIGGIAPYEEATGAITITGSAVPIDDTGLQIFPYKGTLGLPR